MLVVAAAVALLQASAPVPRPGLDRLLFESPATSTAEPVAPKLVVLWYSDAGKIAREELDRLFRGLGLQLRHELADTYSWGDSTGNPAPHFYVHVGAERPAVRQYANVLASTDPRARELWTYDAAIEEGLRLPSRSRRDPAFRVALARLIAHEMLHCLYPDSGHWGGGIMRSHVTRDMLLERVLYLNPPPGDVAAQLRPLVRGGDATASAH